VFAPIADELRSVLAFGQQACRAFPGPIAGAGLPGLILACGVFWPWHDGVVSSSSEALLSVINDELIQSVLAFHGQHAFALGTVIALAESTGSTKPGWGRMANAKSIGWAIYAAGVAIWLFGYLSAGHAPLFDWKAATPWWISSFVPNLEAELGLALMFASMIPTLPWARLLVFAALLVFVAVTLAWWGFWRG
jgi:hypothetical protein